MTKKIERAREAFVNESDAVFRDVTCKSFIRYNFPNGQSVEIQDPIWMATLPTGENLVWNADGVSYKIRPSIGWWKTWETREGCAHFVQEDIRAQMGDQKETQQLNS